MLNQCRGKQVTNGTDWQQVSVKHLSPVVSVRRRTYWSDPQLKAHMFKIEVEDDKGLWSDVHGEDGKVLPFESEGIASYPRWPGRLSMIKAIRRQGGQTRVFDMASGREVVERLKRHVIEPQYLVHRVIKKAADSGSPDANRLRFQIKHLADHACLPEESAIEPRSVPIQA